MPDALHVAVRYFPICRDPAHGERPWFVLARALDVTCDVCGRAVNAFQPRLVRLAEPEAA